MTRYGMRWMVLALGVLAALVAGFYGYWYYQRWDSERRRERLTVALQDMYTLGPPDEFTKEYDPVQTMGVYRVEAVDAGGSVELSYFWPKTKAGEKVRAVIDCKVGDYKIFENGAKVPKIVTKQTFLDTLEANRQRVMLGGLCLDEACTSIVTNCEATITPWKQDEDN